MINKNDLTPQNVLRGEMSVSGQQGPAGPAGPAGPKGDKGDPGEPGGVATWNTRIGNVTPETGDYTLGMVGGIPLTNTEIDEMWNTL